MWSHARCSPSIAKYPTTIVQYHYVLDVVDCTCSYVLIGLEVLNFTVYWAQKDLCKANTVFTIDK